MLKVLDAYAAARVAKNKRHQWVKVASQIALGAKSVKRSGSHNTVCRNSDLVSSHLFVEVVQESKAVTGLKATVVPAALPAFRKVAAQLGLELDD